jgi:RecB family endonuclease NucS
LEYGFGLRDHFSEVFVVVEVKRRRVTVKDVTQLRRYVEALEQRGKQCRAYLAAPEISTSASKYLRKHDLRFLQVDFDAV